MKDWTKMGAGDFYTDGTQLDMLADEIGDGYGTIPMELIPDETGTVAEVEIERTDGTLFGLALDATPATDGGLFTIVAA